MNSIEYLASPQAAESLRLDPYWPKWDSPWWHMTLLWELGLAKQIPAEAAERLLASMDAHFLKEFPLPGKLPAGMDPHRNVACHCALGTIYQVLAACGVDVDARLPWIRPWFLKYQLSDGGLNCDEQAYGKSAGKSSIVSTLPPLEAVLRCTPRSFTQQEESFLDRGAKYLLAHRLFQSTAGKAINPAWLDPVFPRFFEYDVLRGLTFLAQWSAARRKALPQESIAETLQALRMRFRSPFRLTRTIWNNEKTLKRSEGVWSKGLQSSDFPLLRQAGSAGRAAPQLDLEWSRTEALLLETCTVNS